jgi:hypothetical protein
MSRLAYNKSMLKSRFYIFIFGTFIESWIFSLSFFRNQWLWVALAGLLLLRRIYVSYRVDRFVRMTGLFK